MVAAVSQADGAWRRGCEMAVAVVAVVAAAGQHVNAEASVAVVVASVSGLVHRSPGVEGPQRWRLGGAPRRRCRGFGPWHHGCQRRAGALGSQWRWPVPRAEARYIWRCERHAESSSGLTLVRVENEKRVRSQTSERRGQTRLTTGAGNA